MNTKNRLRLVVLAATIGLSAGLCSAQTPLLQVTSPTTGTIVAPGQTATITVSADPSISNALVVGWDPLGFAASTSSPLVFSLTVPPNTPVDQYQVGAIGNDSTGQLTASPPILLDVEIPKTAKFIRVDPPVAIPFRSTDDGPEPITLIATFTDGTTAEVSHSTFTQYQSQDTAVATVNAQGWVTPVGPGRTHIVITYQNAEVSLPVKVAAPASFDTTPPTTTASISTQPNSVGWNNSNVDVTFTATDNTGGSGVKFISITETGAQSGSTQVNASTADVSITSEGMTTIQYFAVDNAGNQEQPKMLTVQLDKTPPAISGMPSNCTLWPPDMMMQQVAVVSAADALSGVANFNVNVTSSEPIAHDQPEFTITGAGLDPRTIQLRRDRLGTGSGRTYTINASATDVAGNGSELTATCIVPHDQQRQQ